jgi:hypothetical protein
VKPLPVRNLWSLELGECIVAEEILERLKGCEVYFSTHDVGVDLLVARMRVPKMAKNGFKSGPSIIVLWISLMSVSCLC